ncbi:sel1-repeat-containing protein ybeq [Anaeramoeba flamelloides]|uniref:Sel1-repeat-containing protein ybeq n=1 Tax=Anaeramoeba flamelloides TaxID=1746091 RepID=A0ABQ8YS18_9EUKA|nr:sel1-repeat-containing protein ybeq [Anaeramoeba flamelloides]
MTNKPNPNTINQDKKKEAVEKGETFKEFVGYTFTQNKNSVSIILNNQQGNGIQDLEIDVQEETIKAGFLGHQTLIEGKLYDQVDASKTTTKIITKEKSEHIEITLQKRKNVEWPLIVIEPNTEGKADNDSIYLLAIKHEEEGEFEIAFKWLQLGADQGHFESIFRIATIYTTETRYPIQTNGKKALHYWEIASQFHHVDSFYMVGYFYFHGIACDKDYKKAKRFFKLAIKAGSTSSYYYLAFIYYEGGFGAEIKEPKAFKNFSYAALNKDTKSLLYLAKMCIEGQGVERDFEKANSYLQTLLSIDPKYPIPNELIIILNRGQKAFEEHLGTMNKKNEQKIEKPAIEPKQKENMNNQKKTQIKKVCKNRQKKQLIIQNKKKILKEKNEKSSWAFSIPSFIAVTGFTFYMTYKYGSNSTKNNDEEN